MYENYVKFRDSKGLKDSDVAKATGISPGTLSDWKKGRYNLKYDKLQRIAEYLGVTTDQLTGVQQDAQQSGYYLDNETAELAQELFENPGMRILFSAAKGSKYEDMKMAAELLERLKQTNPDG